MDSELAASTYAAVAGIRDRLGRNFEEYDMSQHPDRALLIEAAGSYAKTYTGDFDFMKNLHHTSKQYGLSARQAKGALNSMVSEYRRAQSVAERQILHGTPDQRQAAAEQFDTTIENGMYTVVHEDGTWHTYRIRPLDIERYPDFPEGTRVVRYMYGADNISSFTGMAWLYPDGRVHIYQKFLTNEHSKLVAGMRFLLTADFDTRRSAGEQYALKSGKCCICNRDLSVETSIIRGMGPICAGRVGL